ncbi:hypothetical protein QR680_010923 [Steinernema hermaphroditum]|uniref:Uncharacterized protein n=1 Tax=Steinernema hermaphroditum TaxID=289476 RepID=A0AA39IRQ3_9BILA|nr:hypothetical protein QR680_010923 [Steinernema hermaphroditum]
MRAFVLVALLVLASLESSHADTVFYTISQQQACAAEKSLYCPESNWFRFYSCSASNSECYYHMQPWALGFFAFLAISIIPSCVGAVCGYRRHQHRQDHCC